jgi:hypothetical protein
MTMVEKVAMALAEMPCNTGVAFRHHFRDGAEAYREIARVAIEAMRSASPEMLAAAWRQVSVDKAKAGIARLGPGPGMAEWWHAAIDAALKEAEQG